tara:strand:+ start:17809 stop:18516 length:708 start_codon:yes stop_codon:yes gene_type:complete
MNFIASTVERRSPKTDSINIFGGNYLCMDAAIPSGSSSGEVNLRLLCYNSEGPKLNAFKNWVKGNRAFISGDIYFYEDTTEPLYIIINTLETNIPSDMYVNQVVLGNAFIANNEIKERKNNQIACKIGTTLNNSDVTTWLWMESHSSRQQDWQQRIRKGLPICVRGYLREYRKNGDTSSYRALSACDFSTRKQTTTTNNKPYAGNAVGYGEQDPLPKLEEKVETLEIDKTPQEFD